MTPTGVARAGMARVGLIVATIVLLVSCVSVSAPDSETAGAPEPTSTATPVATATTTPPLDPTVEPTTEQPTEVESGAQVVATSTPPPTLEPVVVPGWRDGECVSPPVAAPDPERPTYTGEVNVDPRAGIVTGSIEIDFAPDLATDQLVLRLWPNGPREASTGVNMRTSNLRVDGEPVTADESDPTLRTIALAATLEPGERAVISVDFRIAVPGPGRARVARGDGADPWMRLGSALPLLPWEPGVGWAVDPGTGLFAEAVTSPSADYRIRITAPNDYDVLASGTPDGAGEWVGEAIRDFSISVGHFNLVERVVNAPDPVTVTMGVDASVNEDPVAYMDRIEASLVDFSEMFGPYPWPSLSVALTPGIGGGIEFPTHIMLGDNTIGRTTPHEVAHMFFYSLVGNNQGREPWLDEGLASYAEFVHEGRNPAALAYPQSELGDSGQPLAWFEERSGYYETVYVKPAVAVANLGPLEEVTCALRIYLAQNAYGIATTDKFFDAIETVFPDAASVLRLMGSRVEDGGVTTTNSAEGLPGSKIEIRPRVEGPLSRIDYGQTRDGGTQLRRQWSAVGDARAVILLVHGISEHSGRYEHVGAQFAEAGFHTVAFDHRGHGGTSGPRVYVDAFSDFVDDVEDHMAVARRAGLPVVLLGHSMGGLICTAYATEDRPQPDLLVLSAPALAAVVPAWQRFLAPRLAQLAPKLFVPSASDPTVLSRDKAVQEAFQQDPLIKSGATARLGSELFTAMEQVSGRLDRVAVPTLVLHGDADGLVPVEASAGLEGIAGVERRVLPGLRHEIFNEPEGPALLADVTAWINDQLPRTSR